MRKESTDNHERDPGRRRIAELLLLARDTATFPEELRRELNDLLRASEENRAFAAQFLLDGESLRELLATDEIAGLSAGHTHRHAAIRPRRRLFQRRWIAATLSLAAAAAVAVGLSLAWKARGPIAVIEDEASAVFASDSAPRDGRLERRAYTLLSGMIAVEFRNGVSMTVKAPAEFEVINEYRVRLTSGQIHAIAPESAYGFVVETPEVDVQDLGTEFGVSVDPASGDSEVHVFDGEVNVKRKNADETLASLSYGESARIQHGHVDTAATTDPKKFPTPADVAFSRWQANSARLRDDPDVLFYYDFSRNPGDDRLLPDRSTNDEKVDGQIVGARWVSGRWPGKSALLFDKPGDKVAVNVPGDLPRFTFSAWVNIDRLDAPKTSIFSSIGWGEGKVHLHIPRSLESFTAGVYPKSYKVESGAKLTTGRWFLLTAVVDAPNQTASTWINGKMAFRFRFDGVPRVHPGLCLIGSAGPTLETAQSRPLVGRIDEAILWRRALSPDEIRKLFRKGRPRAKHAADS